MTSAIFQGFKSIKKYQNYIIIETNDGDFQLPSKKLPQLIKSLSKRFWLMPFNLSKDYRIIMPSTTMYIILKKDDDKPQTLLELSGNNLKRFKQELASHFEVLSV